MHAKANKDIYVMPLTITMEAMQNLHQIWANAHKSFGKKEKIFLCVWHVYVCLLFICLFHV